MLAHRHHPHRRDESGSDEPGITEIILPDLVSSTALVLPMLAHLSQQKQDRWFTWIVPSAVTKADLESYNFSMQHMRILCAKDDETRLWLLWESLANGNSGTVVACLHDLKEADHAKLQLACAKGGTRGIILRSRGTRGF